ncbi:ankyrin repeat protein, partial [Opisthorchis viverrini]
MSDVISLGQANHRELSATTPSTNAPRLKAHLVAGPNTQSVVHPSHSSFYSSQPSSSFTSGSANPCAPSDHMRGSVPPQKNVSNSSHGAASRVQLMHAAPSAFATHISTPVNRVKQNTQFSPLGQTTDESYFGGPQQSRYDKPTAPLPSRKQRTTSPSAQMPTPVTHGRPPCSTAAQQYPSDRPSGRNAWAAHSSSRTPYTRDAMDSMYGQADSSSSSFISTQVSPLLNTSCKRFGPDVSFQERNSGESSDFITPSSPRTNPRPSTQAELRTNGAVPSGTRGFVSPQPSQELRVKQATLISAPSGNVPPCVATDGFSQETSSVQRKTAAITSPSHPFSGGYGPCDSSSQMTVSELRSIAERQRQQLTRQAQQMQTKEERLAWLRSVRAQSSGPEKLPPPGSELTHDQEARLHKLRGFRGQAEQTRLTNENLAKEIDNFARMLSAKELEVETYNRRTDESQRLLSLIRTCHGTVTNSSTSRTGRLTATKSPELTVAVVDTADLDKPLDLLSVQLPFASERDKKRWRDGLIEADRLDRQITLALSHRTHSKRGPTQLPDSKPEQTPPLRPLAASTTVISGIGSTHQSSKYHVAGEQPGAVTVNACAPNSSSTKLTGVSSSFSSLLTRASSPPTSRRSSLRMLLHASSGDSPRALDPNIPLQRIKTPPRYASRAVINDTYMRRICRDSVEKYKRTASEIYRANVERMAAKHGKSSAIEFIDSKMDKRMETSAADSIEPGEVRLTRDEPDKVLGRTQSASPLDSISSSSSSSLELIGIDQTAVDATKSTEPKLCPVDEEIRQNSGDVDSGLGGSDDTGQSEQTHTGLPSKQRATTPYVSATTVLVDEGHGTDASLSNASVVESSPNRLKSILRKSSSSKRSTSDTASVTDAAGAQSQPSLGSQTRSNSVRFHPLALLLDAALEGDLDLVKAVAAEVSDVSEPNDEGITALHNAVCAGRTEIAEFLVRTAGADVNAGDTDGWTPLHCAASCANLPLARLLVEHGASLHARTLSDQETPLEKCDQGDEEAECEEYLF